MKGDGLWELFPDASQNGTACENANGYCIDGWCRMPNTGAVYPNYYIASVTYSPPGSSSYVEYAAGSKVGTTTSTTWAWENTVSAEYKAGLSLPLVGGATNFNFSRVWGAEETNATDVVETINATTRVRCEPTAGSCGDYINHNDDQIRLMFDTKINVLSYPSASGLPTWMPQVRWGLDFSRAIPQVVKVAWLTGAEPMPSNVAAALAARGIAPSDYAQILNSTPFALDPPARLAPIRTDTST